MLREPKSFTSRTNLEQNFSIEEVREKFSEFAGEAGFTEFAQNLQYFMAKGWRELPPQLDGLWSKFCLQHDLRHLTFDNIVESTFWCLRHDQPIVLGAVPRLDLPAFYQEPHGSEQTDQIEEARANWFPHGVTTMNCRICVEHAIEWLDTHSIVYRLEN